MADSTVDSSPMLKLDPDAYLSHFEGLPGQDSAKRAAVESLIYFASRIAEQFFGVDPVSLAFSSASNSRASARPSMVESKPKPLTINFAHAVPMEGKQKG